MPAIAAGLEEDFPELDIIEASVAVGASRRDTRARLRMLDDRLDGRRALTMRMEPAPRAYRAFARQIGLDPEVDAGMLAALLRERILNGTLPSSNAAADACVVAQIETGVPLWALDSQRVVTSLRIEMADDLWLNVTAADRMIAPLLGAPGGDVAAHARCRVARLYGIVVAGVARATVEEALWVAEQALRA